jgi:hypothetical protein
MARLSFDRRTRLVYEGMDGQLILCGLLQLYLRARWFGSQMTWTYSK